MKNEPSALLQGLLNVGWFRRFWQFMERCTPFFRVAFSSQGLGSRDGRTLIWGKFRRVAISTMPPLARALQKHYGMSGGCRSCGASCNLLFQCPHFNTQSRLCTVYEDRPNICRLFPITPADIRDRDIVAARTKGACGFNFSASTSELVPAPIHTRD